MPPTTPDHNDPALTPSDGLIASLWERVRGLHTAVLQAKAAGDADALAAARLQFRVTTLLLASCPATTMGDLMPKVLVAAMIRAGVEGGEIPTPWTWWSAPSPSMSGVCRDHPLPSWGAPAPILGPDPSMRRAPFDVAPVLRPDRTW